MALSIRPPSPQGGVEPGEKWLKRHQWPAIFFALIVATGMAFSFLWNPLLHHSPNWLTPPDLWSTYRAAQYVIWGGEGQIYNNPAPFQTFPGIAIMLAPIAKLAGLWHLSEGFPVALPRPSAWWLLDPVQLALGATLLFPLDSIARRLDVPTRRRIPLLALEAALIWPSVVLWGHPEDAVSLTFALYGVIALAERRWLRFASFFALATVMQPLVLLILPMCLAYVPLKRWLLTGTVIVLPTVVTLIAPLAQEWSATSRLLLRQPNYFANNHPTPWAAIAPVIDPARTKLVDILKYVGSPHGRHHAEEVVMKVHTLPVVAAGPGRIVAIVIACALGVAIKRLSPTWPQMVWAAALALSLRCVFEPVMVPYYLLPGLALALLVASRLNPVRFWVAAVAAVVCTLLSYRHVSEWQYYVTMVTPLALTLIAAWPGQRTLEFATSSNR